VDLFDQMVNNPDKYDELDPDNLLITPSSNYYDIDKINSLLLDRYRSNSMFMLHCNVRGLPKNFDHLSSMLNCFHIRPDILAITETKLSDQLVTNIELPNYNFFHLNSPTMAGSAGLYVSNKLQSIVRNDLKFNTAQVESCWIELESGNNTQNTVIGCIYRHPTADFSLFSTELIDSIINIIVY